MQLALQYHQLSMSSSEVIPVQSSNRVERQLLPSFLQALGEAIHNFGAGVLTIRALLVEVEKNSIYFSAMKR